MRLLLANLRDATLREKLEVSTLFWRLAAFSNIDLLSGWPALLLRLKECAVKAHRLTGLAGLR
jgi:hypothetical protein